MADPQIPDLVRRGEDELLREWYIEHVRMTVGRSPEDLAGRLGDVRARFDRWMQRCDLRRLLCQNWGYCDRKAHFQSEIQLAAAVGDFLASTAGQVAPYTVAVLLVVHGFDRICDCPPQ